MSNNYFKIDQFKIDGLDCADCALQIEKEIQRLPGITRVNVDVLNARAKISYSEEETSAGQIIKAIETTGHQASPILDIHQHDFKLIGKVSESEIGKLIKRFEALAIVEKVVYHQSHHTISVYHQSDSKIIRDIFKELNISARLVTSSVSENGQKVRLYLPLFAAGLFAVTSFVLSLWAPGSIFLFLSAAATAAFVAFPIVKKAYYELVRRTMGINFLMTTAVSGAFILGEYAEAAMVVFLFALSQVLESKSMLKARKSVNKLFESAPQLANLKQNGKTLTLPVEEINVSDIILIKPGEKIPLDCIILRGESQVNQAPITGESLPVYKNTGDALLAGSINQEGTLDARVTSLAKDSTISRILYLVEEAQAQKSETQTFIEKFSLVYTPIMVSLALIVAIFPPVFFGGNFMEWIYRALVLLVISCPCALVISTPVSIVSALTNASANGVLLKGGRILEKIRDIRAFAFDKTGTITSGDLKIAGLDSFESFSNTDIIQIAAAIEQKSEHHIAKPILRRADELELKIPECKNFKIIPGKGASAEIDQQEYFIGNRTLMMDLGHDLASLPAEINEAGKLQIFIATNENVLGRIILADEIKENARRTFTQLHQLGIQKSIMLTGDNAENAALIAEAAGLDEFAAELLPAEKLDYIIRRKKETPIAMVGDGLNDAPALAASDLGIVMGIAGTDTAIDSADAALMTDNLEKIPYLIKISRAAIRNIKQNIFIALLLKFLFFVLAIPGITTLWMAVFADTGASLIVIFNGLRLLNFKK